MTTLCRLLEESLCNVLRHANEKSVKKDARLEPLVCVKG